MERLLAVIHKARGTVEWNISNVQVQTQILQFIIIFLRWNVTKQYHNKVL